MSFESFDELNCLNISLSASNIAFNVCFVVSIQSCVANKIPSGNPGPNFVLGINSFTSIRQWKRDIIMNK